MNGVKQLVTGLEAESGIPIWLLAILAYSTGVLILFIRYTLMNRHLPDSRIAKKIAVIAAIAWLTAVVAAALDAACLRNLPLSLAGALVITLVVVFMIDGRLNRIFGITGHRFLSDTAPLAKSVGIDEQTSPEATKSRKDADPK